MYHFLFTLFPSSAAGLRTPLAVPGPYPGAFGMLSHPAGMNGELAGAAGAAAYAAGLHNMSPQMSAAAAAAVAAYGRSPMVSLKSIWITHYTIFIIFLSNLTLNLIELGGVSFLAIPSALTCFRRSFFFFNCDFLFAVPL